MSRKLLQSLTNVFDRALKGIKDFGSTQIASLNLMLTESLWRIILGYTLYDLTRLFKEETNEPERTVCTDPE